MNSRHIAAAVTFGGGIVIFVGIASLSVVAAFIILAGALLMVLGLFAVEVPQS